MISEKQLNELNYFKSEEEEGKFVSDEKNANLYLNNGVIDWVNEGDNYHGLKVEIGTISQLISFLSCVK